jgi:hypothetical protein
MPALIRRRQPEPIRAPRIHSPHHVRALTASGAMLDPTNRRDVTSITRYRQPWQETALDYQEEIGEVRFATNLLKSIIKKVGFFPAVYIPGEDDPQPIADSDDKRWAAACQDALDRLGDPGSLGQLAAGTMAGFKVPGEAYLIGRTDRGSGVPREVWEIRSISEVFEYDRQILLRDAPNQNGRTGGIADWRNGEPLGPDGVCCRLWTPSDRWRMLADSPVRTAIPTALEALSALNKEIVATASSRLASAGLLLLPEGLSSLRADAVAAGTAEDDPLLEMLIEAASTAIQEPSSATAAIPIIARGPTEAIKEARHILFGRPDAAHAEERQWALLRLSNVLDLPSELFTGGIGKSTNHWSAFLLDDQKWRDHVEPAARDIVSAWTVSYYRAVLAASGVPDDVLARCIIWYDPTRAIVKSDRTEAATSAYNLGELSGDALRKYLDFDEDDAPDDDERLRRAAEQATLDAASALAILQGKDPEEISEASKPAPIPPQLDPGQADNPDEGDDGRGGEGPPNGGNLPNSDPVEKKKPPASVTAAATPRQPSARATRMSRRLADLDRTLRVQIRQAAEDAVRRALERAGAKLVTRVKRDRIAAAAVRDVPLWAVPARIATLGQAVTAALGLNDQQTLEVELAALALLWRQAVKRGQEQAVEDAAGLLGLDAVAALSRLAPTLQADRDAGWRWLADRLSARVSAALAKDPTASISTSSLVPTGDVRAALAIAGGYLGGTSAGLTDNGLPVDRHDPLGGVGTGRTVSGLLEAGGATVVTYEWVHGIAADPFQPHVDLDGTEFTSWDDPSLANGDAFPDFGGWFPGDHGGCTCQVITFWDGPDGQSSAEEAA